MVHVFGAQESVKTCQSIIITIFRENIILPSIDSDLTIALAILVRIPYCHIGIVIVRIESVGGKIGLLLSIVKIVIITVLIICIDGTVAV
jgi:hypothetical protein